MYGPNQGQILFTFMIKHIILYPFCASYNNANVFRLAFSWCNMLTYGKNIWTGFFIFSPWESLR